MVVSPGFFEAMFYTFVGGVGGTATLGVASAVLHAGGVSVRVVRTLVYLLAAVVALAACGSHQQRLTTLGKGQFAPVTSATR